MTLLLPSFLGYLIGTLKLTFLKLDCFSIQNSFCPSLSQKMALPFNCPSSKLWRPCYPSLSLSPCLSETCQFSPHFHSQSHYFSYLEAAKGSEVTLVLLFSSLSTSSILQLRYFKTVSDHVIACLKPFMTYHCTWNKTAAFCCLQDSVCCLTTIGQVSA